MPALVNLFFVFVTLSTIATGLLLPRYVPGPTARRFGIALSLVGGAFALWTFAVITKQSASLYTWMTLGLIFLLPALLFLIGAGTTGLPAGGQRLALALGVALSIVLVALRWVFPSNPHFSEAGLFYFGEQPYVKFVTISLLTATIIPATLALGREIEMQSGLAAKVFVGACVTELIGSVLLLSSDEDVLLFPVGWAMGIGFLLLLLVAAGAFNRAPLAGRSR